MKRRLVGKKAIFQYRIIRKWAICRKNENFTVWKCARMHERAPRGRFLLSEYAPNHAWHTKGGINGKSLRKRVELNYSNWPGLTLSSPIRFSSADRRTKSIRKDTHSLPSFGNSQGLNGVDGEDARNGIDWKDAHSLRGNLPIEGLQNPARGSCIFWKWLFFVRSLRFL